MTIFSIFSLVYIFFSQGTKSGHFQNTKVLSLRVNSIIITNGQGKSCAWWSPRGVIWANGWACSSFLRKSWYHKIILLMKFGAKITTLGATVGYRPLSLACFCLHCAHRHSLCPNQSSFYSQNTTSTLFYGTIWDCVLKSRFGGGLFLTHLLNVGTPLLNIVVM